MENNHSKIDDFQQKGHIKHGMYKTKWATEYISQPSSKLQIFLNKASF